MIRKYRLEDLPRLREITILGFDGVSIDQNIEQLFGPIGGTDWRFRKARHIDWDAQANADGILVWEEEGEVVGFIATRVDSQTKIGGIPDMAVHPEHQGRGIGKALMQAALDYLKAAGMEYVRIETLEQNQVAAAFYRKVGFVEVARQIHYVKKLA